MLDRISVVVRLRSAMSSASAAGILDPPNEGARRLIVAPKFEQAIEDHIGAAQDVGSPTPRRAVSRS